MNGKKTTRRALVLSLLSLLLCCSMLVGTTFAWFTDSVQSGTNRIVAGNLDVDLVTADGNSVQNVETLFDDVTLWEPGAVAWESLTVKNLGTLALKYELNVVFGNENTVVDANGVDTGYGLSDVLQVALIEGGVKGKTREAVLAEAQAAKVRDELRDFSVGGELIPQDNDTYGIVIWWAPGAEDNNWNVNNGKSTSDGRELHIDLDVLLNATQKVYEDDSFGPDYDAGLETSYVSTYEELAAALDQGGKVVLENSIQLPDGEKLVIPEGIEVIFDLAGKTVSGGYQEGSTTKHVYVIDNNGTLYLRNGNAEGRGVANHGKLVVDNMNITAIDTNGGGAIWNYSGSETTVNSGTFVAADASSSPAATVLNVASNSEMTINGGTFVGEANQTYAVINGGNLTINGGNFSADHGVVSNTDTVTINGGTFVQNGNLKQTSSLLYSTNGTATITGGTFNFNVGGNLDSGLPIYCSGGNVAISGGTFTGYVTEMISSWGGSGSASVTGGTFEKDPVYVADGYVAKQNSDGTYNVMPEKYEDGTLVADGLYKAANTSEYAVSNANGLATLNGMMADKTAGRDAVVELTADIDMTGKTWTPVDSHADTAFEIAEINGNGHTISNLTINGQAMFTRFAGFDEVVIKNVTFENVKVNSNGSINTAVITGHTYQNVTLENVDVKNSTISGGYKVAPLIGTVYNESASTITATLKNCDVENVVVSASGYDFCTTGLVAFVYEDDNDGIVFENCSVKNVKLVAPLDGYAAHAFVYAAGSTKLHDSAAGVTVEGCTVEQYLEDSSSFAGGTLTLRDGTYVSAQEGENALTITGDTTLVVEGEATLTGGKNGAGIYVADGVKLTITGNGDLCVYGNSTIEYEASGNYCEYEIPSFEDTGASGIRGGEGSTIIIDGLNSLTAEGYGVHGFGIGGNGATVSISNTTIDFVRGGFVNVNGEYIDEKYNKDEPQGAPAIGGAKITIKNTYIKEALGGSKGAGIGAQFHQPTDVTIINSVIDYVEGGASCAGIGGGRVGSKAVDQTTVVTIEDSNITAVGGYFGAGIGTGYNTYCNVPNEAPMNTINIKGDSVINATGGKYAAGIGTGFHVANLTGEIEQTVKVTAVSGEKTYKATYTSAQNVGFGVTDPAREGLNNTSSIKFGGEEITIPSIG